MRIIILENETYCNGKKYEFARFRYMVMFVSGRVNSYSYITDTLSNKSKKTLQCFFSDEHEQIRDFLKIPN